MPCLFGPVTMLGKPKSPAFTSKTGIAASARQSKQAPITIPETCNIFNSQKMYDAMPGMRSEAPCHQVTSISSKGSGWLPRPLDRRKISGLRSMRFALLCTQHYCILKRVHESMA